MPVIDLADLLRRRFGHAAFRPHQEEVCRAVAAGQDALLVMPTGSGKSLCYQLPGLARGGTTLVVSPLIALMEDQTAKLVAMGVKAERVHSGRSREQSRAACRAYLDGELDFLTISPERLGVPGFPEMLARRPPVLVAVDEAHCISHWGHDFRPEYRLLGARLPSLRPAPVLALTATATVRVQDDILEQLGVKGARRFICGFRRDNLSIEAVECARTSRAEDALALLAPAERRPAVVYVPTRRLADEVAELFSAHHETAPYHAGLPAAARSRAQEAFLAGSVEVVVATIAFGMGIDKANIRTVVHLALPQTLEGYYQEIGRAGRDGLPSCAVLLYSFGDRKVHESFLDRDYPDIGVLEQIAQAVPTDGIGREALIAASPVDAEVAEVAVSKLWTHGGVTVDADDRVHRGHDGWRASYRAIRRHREGQLDEVFDFARAHGCRMVHLVRHFGETENTAPCTNCDVCRPRGSIGHRFRPPTPAEAAVAAQILEELRRYDGVSTGTLYRNLFPNNEVERRELERVLEALRRAQALVLVDDSFEKDGKTVRFRRAHLNRKAGGALDAGLLFEGEPGRPTTRGRRPRSRRRERGGAEGGDERRSAVKRGFAVEDQAIDLKAVDRLRAWRLAVARAKGVPAFRIMSDRTLYEIVAATPTSLAALGQVYGAGPKLVERYGAAILAELQAR
ncbi:MAG: ATP-dependent DNA helicase RecQ [Deltaproteobacteria bacterium]|nr:ATP-dependent DNA helicase RecQ [Deltaproteobacteria bacterium]